MSNPAGTPPTADAAIVRAAIHPAIGVARVGNSADGYFVGPEVTDPLPAEPGSYRDAKGALKRQAARFRVYGYDAEGRVVRELTAGDAEVRWTVHVANRKAGWYEWQIALDIPEAAAARLPLRNAGVTGDGRAALDIDGGARTIAGRNASGDAFRFEGRFGSTPVYLGELRTDEEGRLLFLGGHGVSASPEGKPIFDPNVENSFINAEGWYDDTSDGPVTAEVSIGGRSIPVEPAWVLTGPPNYGPDVVGVRTLYDLLFDLYVQAGSLELPAEVSFRDDVYPILQRLSGLQWVNAGFATQFGKGGPNDFEDPDYVHRLSWLPPAGGFDTWAELRLQVLHAFRDPEGTSADQLPWPWIYGDAMDVPPADTPRQNAAVSPTQYRVLQQWAAGRFVPDWDPAAEPPRTLEEVEPQRRPDMLTKAALHFCLADAFHPGCEVTWPIRHLTLYASPFRVLHRPDGVPEPDYGPVLTPAIALSDDGPLHAQGPGDLTRWMGLPWQADTAYCRAGYSTKDYAYDPYVPTFWPARVPNQVLTAEAYARVTDRRLPREQRLAAYADRATWTRALHGTTAQQMEQMVADFGAMGVVEMRPGIRNDPDFPPVMGVEDTGAPAAAPRLGAPAAAEAVPAEAPAPATPRELLREQAVRRAGWASTEEADSAPLPVRHPKK